MELATPLVVVGFKTYPQATGERAVKLARVLEEVSARTGVSLAVAPQHADLYRVAREVSIPVLAQHVDPLEPGRHTGWVTPASVRAAGAKGTFINHSEHKLELKEVELAISLSRATGLLTLAFAAGVEESKHVARFGPDFIFVEPPELVGTGIPVSRARAEVLRSSLEAIKAVNPGVKVLCGAGITKGEDVRRALELGMEGVGVASGVVCAEDPRAAIEDIVSGVKRSNGTL